jgi:hypothetical protein
VNQWEVGLYRHWFLLRRWLINLPAFLVYQPYRPIRIGSCTAQLHFQGQSEFASNERHFLVFRSFATHGIHANQEIAPRPALVRKNFGNSNTLTDVKVLTPVDRFAPEFWLPGGSSGSFAQPADTAIAGAARNPNFAIAVVARSA